MSREILFRGKSLETGEWVHGGYIDVPSGSFIDKIVWNGEKNWKLWAVPVDPSTVCQYAGLTDKNGTKIFENDIVRFKGYSADICGWVRFGSYSDAIGTADTNYGWFIDFIQNNGYYRQDFGYWVNKITVIGNYFDNPEMLEEGADQ